MSGLALLYIATQRRRERLAIDRQEMIDAWNEYQASGLHVTGDEVIAWLETWGDEDELPPPECHT